jgi:hypothetical protein
MIFGVQGDSLVGFGVKRVKLDYNNGLDNALEHLQETSQKY